MIRKWILWPSSCDPTQIITETSVLFLAITQHRRDTMTHDGLRRIIHLSGFIMRREIRLKLQRAPLTTSLLLLFEIAATSFDRNWMRIAYYTSRGNGRVVATIGATVQRDSRIRAVKSVLTRILRWMGTRSFCRNRNSAAEQLRTRGKVAGKSLSNAFDHVKNSNTNMYNVSVDLSVTISPAV